MKHSSFKVRKVEGHKCLLPQEGDLVSLHIDEGSCVGFRRKWRQLFLVDPKNPQSKSILKSTALIRREEARHLRRYYYMIHPFSQAKATWELIMIVVLWGQFITMPIGLGTFIPIREVLWSKAICNFLSYIDVILTFFTGYVDVKSNRVVLDSKKICKKYLLTFFFADIISSFPYSLVFRLAKASTIHTCKYFYYLRLVRLPTLVTYMQRFAIVSPSIR